MLRIGDTFEGPGPYRSIVVGKRRHPITGKLAAVCVPQRSVRPGKFNTEYEISETGSRFVRLVDRDLWGVAAHYRMTAEAWEAAARRCRLERNIVETRRHAARCRARASRIDRLAEQLPFYLETTDEHNSDSAT